MQAYAWDKELSCPLICTCQLQHLTETAIYRFMQNDKVKLNPGEMGIVENNEVFTSILKPIYIKHHCNIFR